MKIAFINISQGKVHRGSEVFVAELSKRLSKDNDVDVISGNTTPPVRWPILWRLYIDPNGIYICWFTLKNLWKIYKNKYDVIIPLNGGWQSFWIRAITLRYGGKMIISGQSGFGWDDRINLLSFPNVFVPISSRGMNWSKFVNPFVKTKYIPNGVDLNKFKYKKPRLQTTLKKPIILCVAALTKSKRIDLTIKAVSKLKKTSLLIIGDGPLRQEISDLGKQLLGDRFALTSLPHRDMPEVYRIADAFTLVSEKSEAFGIVNVEALSTNLPVVATDDSQRKEIIGDAGILVDPTSIDRYAKALNKTLKTKWGNNPRKQAQKFSWDKIATQYEELLSQLTS